MSASISTVKNSPKGSSKSLSPPQLPMTKRCNSCALTYSVNRGLMRTATGLEMCAPLSPNVYHQVENADSETSPSEAPLLQLNGGRLSETLRAQMARGSMTSNDAATSEKARLSCSPACTKSRSTKSSSTMLTIPECGSSRGRVSRGSLNVGRMGSWAEYAAANPTSPPSPMEEMTPEERKSAIDAALATILTIPECRESLRQTIAAKMNWSEWAVSPYGGSASPISPFDFYQAAGIERQGSYMERQSIRAPPGLASAPATGCKPNACRTPPTPLPLMTANVDAYEQESCMGRAAAVRRNPWATATGHHHWTPTPSPFSAQSSSAASAATVDAPKAQGKGRTRQRKNGSPNSAPASIWDRAVIENEKVKAEQANNSKHVAKQAPKVTVTAPMTVIDFKANFTMKVINLSLDEENIYTKLSKKVRQPRGKGKSKYTCHIFLPEEIATDKAFRAASYLIGNGGQNMKLIHDRTAAKLRVRGIGSGFKERGDFEADAPMHLCISADSMSQMEKTKDCVFPLFERLIDAYCRNRGTDPETLAVQVAHM